VVRNISILNGKLVKIAGAALPHQWEDHHRWTDITFRVNNQRLPAEEGQEGQIHQTHGKSQPSKPSITKIAPNLDAATDEPTIVAAAALFKNIGKLGDHE